jgi:hypothetical protein
MDGLKCLLDEKTLAFPHLQLATKPSSLSGAKMFSRNAEAEGSRRATQSGPALRTRE